ncbi:hypothetical protein ACFVH6_21585 [Spirillospora sp. NPDC127200]
MTEPAAPDAFIRAYKLSARNRMIEGLRALADFLEANPALPVEGYPALTVFTNDNDCEPCQRAEIDRIARLLGTNPHDDTDQGGHLTVSRSFGPVEYNAIFIPATRLAAHQALMSYADNFADQNDADAPQAAA